MDCVDCHNRPSHIYYSARETLDRAINNYLIPRELPFIKKKGLELITDEYSSKDEAIQLIAAGLIDWYKANYPDIAIKKKNLIDQATSLLCRKVAGKIYILK